MELVSKHLQIQRVPCGRIGVLRSVAHDTHFHAMSITAVEGQLSVARVTTLSADDIAGHSNRRAIRDEVEGGARVAGALVVQCQIPVAVHSYSIGHSRVKSRGRLGPESV